MAYSPSVSSPAASATSVIPTKTKVRTVLTGTGQSKNNSKMTSEAPSDLAEKMNEESKNKWAKTKSIGAGTYANVYLGHLKRRRPTEETFWVAIKKIKKQENYQMGIPPDAVREIKFLQELKHTNIIRLHDVYSSKNQNLNLVLEYLPRGDLETLIHARDELSYSLADMKAWMGMLCRGVWFCHENYILHRDIKPNNLLIGADGEVKLADFGLARSFADPAQLMTSMVITRWYRPPELFYKAQHYSGAVDVWSIGCVFAELIKRFPYLVGDTDMGQLAKICEFVGTPTETNWPGVTKLKNYVPPSQTHPVRDRDYYRREFGAAGDDGVDLLMSMLKLDPRKRATCQETLQHKWWSSEPRPTRTEKLPRKARGTKKVGEDLKRPAGDLEPAKVDKVARKLDFKTDK